MHACYRNGSQTSPNAKSPYHPDLSLLILMEKYTAAARCLYWVLFCKGHHRVCHGQTLSSQQPHDRLSRPGRFREQSLNPRLREIGRQVMSQTREKRCGARRAGKDKMAGGSHDMWLCLPMMGKHMTMTNNLQVFGAEPSGGWIGLDRWGDAALAMRMPIVPLKLP